VQALVVITLTDEAVEISPGIFQVEIVLPVDLLSFQRFVEALDTGIIVRIALSRHTQGDTLGS